VTGRSPNFVLLDVSRPSCSAASSLQRSRPHARTRGWPRGRVARCCRSAAPLCKKANAEPHTRAEVRKAMSRSIMAPFSKFTQEGDTTKVAPWLKGRQ
jgi:hypothetical protein